ncbi:cbb3-type cytochrome oxidase assembly protein CcoS [Kiloniella sp. b19]|uniref:cbb3-type cytochrome oxidase assembly protein CcoS n=1 Tax=Kiloniella sp. GXU_MW_B19 TaxID=3141326 RepID=UPI0031E45F3B
MDVLIFLIPVALFLGGIGLVCFLWSLRSGQYEDLEGASYRALFDDEDDITTPPEHDTGKKQ